MISDSFEVLATAELGDVRGGWFGKGKARPAYYDSASTTDLLSPSNPIGLLNPASPLSLVNPASPISLLHY